MNNPHPNATRLIYTLIKRKVITSEASRGLSAAGMARIESGETSRRDAVWLLRARDAAALREERANGRR